MLKVILKCSFQPAHLAFILHLLGSICCKPSAFLQLYLSLTCWKSINYTTSPWHHRANTSCSWPYVCVSSLDWINFRCGVCPGLLQRVCCDFEPLLLLLFFLQPPSHPSLLLHLPEGLLSQHAIFQHPTHEELSRAHTLTHTHICLGSCLQTVISHAIPAQWWNAWRNPSLHPRTLRLSLFPLSVSGGVITDRGLIINSIKWVWLPWQIGLGYNIIISASSAVTMGHGSQMRVRLIGREDVVSLYRNIGRDWVCLCEKRWFSAHTQHKRKYIM